MSGPHIRNLPYLQKINIPGLEGHKLAEAFDDLGNGIGNISNQMASNPDGRQITPPKISSVQAQHLGAGILNFAIVDNAAQLQRAVDYTVEISPNSGFSSSETIHFSPSRNGHVPVPNGKWYVKAYSQYRYGGGPSESLITGPISVTGSPYGSRLGGQGCGTAAPNATGQGAGSQITRGGSLSV